ncbi:MAG: 6,7-dimethyl-8-ribityllumazine synthase [Acidimicrobiia bacterium]
MRVREVKGEPTGGKKIGVVVARFNGAITDALLAGALEALEEAGTAEVTVITVPGALELAVAAKHLIETGHEAVVAVAAVIRGETDHYEHVATQSMMGLSQLALATGVPIGNAVLTVHEYEHARDRSLPGRGNKGYEAAMAVLELLDSLVQILDQD